VSGNFYESSALAFLSWTLPLIEDERDLLRQFRAHGSIEVSYAETDPNFASYCQDDESAEYAFSDRIEQRMEIKDETIEGSEKVKPAKNANLSNRLPREDFAIVIPFDDRAPLMERCKDVLKDRMGENRQGYLLDGKPANTDKVVRAAGLQYADEEVLQRSPPTRRRKRRRPLPKT
jgi:hypothetical protein